MGMRVGLSLMIAGLLASGCAGPSMGAATPPPSKPGEKGPVSRSLRAVQDIPLLASCRVRRDQPGQPKKTPFLLIEEGPLPDEGPDRPLTPAETKCVESLREAGKKAIEEGDLLQGANHYLSAVDTARSLAGDIYRDLADALDEAAYVQLAVAAYTKAWMVVEAGANRPGMKNEGNVVLALADIRDALTRLGASLPQPISEPGRLVLANPTRKLKERYFDVPPLTK
jgi:hypothetical protein